MSANESNRKARGMWIASIIWLPWTIVLGLVIALTIVTYNVHKGTGSRDVCAGNLEQLFDALDAYNDTHGKLPSAQFFARDPEGESDSLLNQLLPYEGTDHSHFVCPGVPALVSERVGVTYCWNVELNGQRLERFDDNNRQWMLVEITALDGRLKAPHFANYNVLYTDGKVDEAREPPPGVCSQRSGND